MHTKQLSRVRIHGRNLLAIFRKATERDPVKLCKKLRALEGRAEAVALRLCNGPEYPGGPDEVDRLTDAILDKVNALLRFRESGPAVFVNRDPRGYALKIDSEAMQAGGYVLAVDWGGYGLIAPWIS